MSAIGEVLNKIWGLFLHAVVIEVCNKLVRYLGYNEVIAAFYASIEGNAFNF